MTETQAHEFLAKCESRLLWRKVGDENTVVKRLTRNFRIGFIAGIIWLGVAAWDFSNSNKAPLDYFFVIALLIIALLQIGFAIWLLLRLRQARFILRGKI
jgi:hypothetical protein